MTDMLSDEGKFPLLHGKRPKFPERRRHQGWCRRSKLAFVMTGGSNNFIRTWDELEGRA
jgi:hypothetical protein